MIIRFVVTTGGLVNLSKAEIIREEIEEDGTLYSAILIEFKNAYVVVLSEGGENLGTLAYSMPLKPETSTVPLSSILLGERNKTISRLIAERLASTVNRMVLVSVYSRNMDERKIGRIFLGLLEKILKKKEP